VTFDGAQLICPAFIVVVNASVLEVLIVEVVVVVLLLLLLLVGVHQIVLAGVAVVAAGVRVSVRHLSIRVAAEVIHAGSRRRR
jgi:hypothetical protein